MRDPIVTTIITVKKAFGYANRPSAGEFKRIEGGLLSLSLKVLPNLRSAP